MSKEKQNQSETRVRVKAGATSFCLTLQTQPRHLTSAELSAMGKDSLPLKTQPLVDGSLTPELASASLQRQEAELQQLADKAMKLLQL